MILTNLGMHRTGVNCSGSGFLDDDTARFLCREELFWIMFERFQALRAAEIEGFSVTFKLMCGVFRYVHAAHRISKL